MLPFGASAVSKDHKQRFNFQHSWLSRTHTKTVMFQWSWGQKQGDGVMFPLQTDLQETCKFSFASARAFSLVLPLLSDRENLNNSALWWKRQDFCLLQSVWKKPPIWMNPALGRGLFSYLPSWEMLLNDMSGGLLGIPGIFANRRCMNSVKGDSFKIVSSPPSSISSPTCWTRIQLFLELGFLQTLWLFHSREFGINSMQMTALRRPVTEEFMASHLSPICYKRKGERERGQNSNCSPPASQSRWKGGAQRLQPGSPEGQECQCCQGLHHHLSHLLLQLLCRLVSRQGRMLCSAGKGHQLMAAVTSCAVKTQYGNARLKMWRYHGFLQGWLLDFLFFS